MSENNKFIILRNNIIGMMSQVTDKFLFFIINAAIARYLIPAEYGIYATALAFGTFFAMLSNAGVDSYLKRQINLHPRQEPYHIGSALMAKGAAGFSAYLVMLVSLLFTGYSVSVVHLVFILGAVRLGNELINSMQAFFEAKELFLNAGMLRIGFSLVLLIFTVSVILGGGGYYAIAFVRLAAVLLVFTLVLVYVYYSFRPRFVLSQMKKYLVEMRHFLFLRTAEVVYQLSPVVLVSFIVDETGTGMYSNARMITMMLVFLPNTLNDVILPQLYRAFDSDDREKMQFSYDLYNRYYALLGTGAAVVVYTGADFLVTLAYGAEYLPAADALKMFSLQLPFLFIVGAAFILAFDKQKVYARIVSLVGVLQTVLIVVLTWKHGIAGGALACAIAGMVLFILVNVDILRNEGINGGVMLRAYGSMGAAGTFIAYATERYLLTEVHPLLAIVIAGSSLVVFFMLFLFKKDDIRIIRESIGR